MSYKCEDFHLEWKAFLSKFQTINFWFSPLETKNCALSTWTKHQYTSGGTASLSGLSRSESPVGTVRFYLPNLTTTLPQVDERQHKRLTDPSQRWCVSTHSKVIPQTPENKAGSVCPAHHLLGHLHMLGCGGATTGTKGRVPVFPLHWIWGDAIVTTLLNEFIKIKGVKLRWNEYEFSCSWHFLILI